MRKIRKAAGGRQAIYSDSFRTRPRESGFNRGRGRQLQRRCCITAGGAMAIVGKKFVLGKLSVEEAMRRQVISLYQKATIDQSINYMINTRSMRF